MMRLPLRDEHDQARRIISWSGRNLSAALATIQVALGRQEVDHTNQLF